MFKRILVATDGSTHSRRAVAVASSIARSYGAELDVIHVLGAGEIPESMLRMFEAEHLVRPVRKEPQHPIDISGNLALSHTTRSLEQQQQLHQLLADRFVHEAENVARASGVQRVATHVENGNPVDRILECATRVQADMIVMGTRGLSQIKELLMGSVSHRVCQLAECACLTVK